MDHHSAEVLHLRCRLAGDPDDRRSVRARVTSAGQKRLDEIRSEMHQASDTIVGNFTDEELIQLRHLSLKLVQNMYAKEAR